MNLNGDDVIGVTSNIRFMKFSNHVRGRVDSGASICSLHATNIDVDRVSHRVSFECPSLSHNIITMKLEQMMAVRTPDGGIENRPVVKFDIEIQGKHLKDIEFNLNNREHMDEPVLIGENAIRAGKFLINVAAKESIDLTSTETMIDNPVETVYNLMMEHNISLIDLVKFAQIQLAESVLGHNKK